MQRLILRNECLCMDWRDGKIKPPKPRSNLWFRAPVGIRSLFFLLVSLLFLLCFLPPPPHSHSHSPAQRSESSEARCARVHSG